MDLLRHIRVLWAHRLVMAVGILAGSLLAVLVSYNVQPGKSPMITPRGHEEWVSVSRLLVTQEGFPEGRVTLPGAAASASKSSGLQFADPARFEGLASLYAVLASSDQVRERLAQKPKREQLSALVVDPDGPGSLSSLPIIELSTAAESAAGAKKLNVDTVAALRGVLLDQQNENKIDTASRVRLDSLDLPSAPALLSGRSRITSIVVFAIALLAAIGFAQLLEGVGGTRVAMPSRGRRRGAAPPATPAGPRSGDKTPTEWRLPERPPAPPEDDKVASVSKLRRS